MTTRHELYSELEIWVKDKIEDLEIERDEESMMWQEGAENPSHEDYEICIQALNQINKDYHESMEFLENLL